MADKTVIKVRNQSPQHPPRLNYSEQTYTIEIILAVLLALASFIFVCIFLPDMSILTGWHWPDLGRGIVITLLNILVSWLPGSVLAIFATGIMEPSATTKEFFIRLGIIWVTQSLSFVIPVVIVTAGLIIFGAILGIIILGGLLSMYSNS